MHGFVQKIQRRIREKRLLERGSRVVLAVSGGPDSVAMARAMAELPYTLSLAWVFHGHRPGARSDGALVQALAGRLNVPFIELHASPETVSEAGLRDARYAMFDELKCDAIATAHTASDQAETVLMRMIRGTGVAGLAGIPDVRGRYVRPLLGVTRADVMSYLHDIGQEYAIDPTNAELEPLRNRVRHILLPLLEEEFQPRIASSLQRLAESVRLDRDTLEQVAAAHIDAHGAQVAPLRQAISGVRLHVIRQLSPASLSFERAQALERLVCGELRGVVQLEGGAQAVVQDGLLVFSP